MSSKTWLFITVNAAIAVIGYFAFRFTVLSSPEPKSVPPTINDIRREFLKAKREGRVEVHDGLSPEFIKKMNRRKWIFHSDAK